MQKKIRKIKYLLEIFGPVFLLKLILLNFVVKRPSDIKIANIKLREFIKKDLSFNKTKQQVLFIVPWMIFGGSDKVNLDILSHINLSKFELHFITDVKRNNVWGYRFRRYTNHIFHLPEIIPPSLFSNFLIQYISLNKISTILISNSSFGYEVLPEVRAAYPDIKIADLLHGQGGHHESGGFPKFSEPYDKYIDTRIAINNYLKDYLIANFKIKDEKIEVIYNGIDAKEFRSNVTEKGKFRKLLKVNKSVLLITYLGRLSYEKHPEKIIEIAEYLLSKNITDIKFIIGGDGIMKDELVGKVNASNLSEYVKIIGYVEDTANLINDSDVLIILSEMEGLPIVILEALALGVPVIATQVGGIPEIIDNKKDGFLINFDNKMVANFSDKIVALKDKELWKSLSKNARGKINDKFSIEKMVESYEKIFKH